jgi:hypothetical protein
MVHRMLCTVGYFMRPTQVWRHFQQIWEFLMKGEHDFVPEIRGLSLAFKRKKGVNPPRRSKSPGDCASPQEGFGLGTPKSAEEEGCNNLQHKMIVMEAKDRS